MKITLHKFQEAAFTSEKKVIVCAAGIQSGKTSVGATFILARGTSVGPEDNLIVCAPTYKILQQATLPKLLLLTKDLGEYHKGDSVFKFFHGPTIYIRSLTDPNAMEGITNVEGIWLDEGGLISRYAWENVEGRAAFREAPVIITTTPYSLNWLYQLWKDWKAGNADDTDFIIFRSIDNPYFPKAEYERQKRKLDPVRFAMKYDGVFGQMEGLVFPNVLFIKARELPTGTKYYGGVDWGYTNPFALTIRAVTPDGLHYRVAEFYKSGLTVEEQIQAVKSRQVLYNMEIFIADPSNPGAIRAFNQAGLRCVGGKNDIIEGIDKHRELINSQRFFVFEDENPYGFDEYQSYHYPEMPDLKIDEDQKEQVPVDKNNHTCFVAGTLVQTAFGDVPIENIKVGDLILSPLGKSKVLSCGVTSKSLLYRIVVSGKEIYSTKDHPFYQLGRGFSPAERGNIVWKRSSSMAGSIGYGMAIISGVMGLCTAMFGSSTTEPYRRVITSTTKTITLEIMTFLTWNALRLKSIGLNILRPKSRRKKSLNFGKKKLHTLELASSAVSISKPKATEGFGVRELVSRLLDARLGYMIAVENASYVEHSSKLRNTNQQKPVVEFAPENTLIENQIGISGNTSVSYAAIDFMQKAKTQSFAEGHAKTSFSEKIPRPTLLQSASFAAKIFSRIAGSLPRLAVIDVVENTQLKSEVYNLRTEHGCYFANGILVSNCDADRYVTMYLTQAVDKRKLPITPNSGEKEPPNDALKRLNWLKKGGSSRYKNIG